MKIKKIATNEVQGGKTEKHRWGVFSEGNQQKSNEQSAVLEQQDDVRGDLNFKSTED